MEQLDKLRQNQWAIAGAAGLFFILTFLPYVTASVHYSGTAASLAGSGGGGGSVSAWHSYAILGILLVFIGVGAHYAQPQIRSMAPPTLPVARIAWIVTAVGVVLVAIRCFTASASYSGLGVSASEGPGWGGILLIIVGIVIVALQARTAETSGAA